MSTAHRSAAIFHPNELSGERLFDPIGVCPHVTIDAMGGEQVLDEARNQARALATMLEHAVVGQQAVIQQVLWGLIGGGHVLLEGPPGVGKTSLVKALGAALGLQFRRVQFTPDLLPSDITGNAVLELDELGRPRGGFRFRPGPLFTHLLLADEINRASPRTQSALLEAMQEGSVTIDGTTHPLPAPFAVLATQNPYDMEGTFPLPEAQRDRFLVQLHLDAPGLRDLTAILLAHSTKATLPPFAPGDPVRAPDAAVADLALLQHARAEVLVAPAVAHYAARIVEATDPRSTRSPASLRAMLRYGISVRGALALLACAQSRALLAGRAQVSLRDVREVARPVLTHRLLVAFPAEADGVTAESIMNELLSAVPEHSDESSLQL